MDEYTLRHGSHTLLMAGLLPYAGAEHVVHSPGAMNSELLVPPLGMVGPWQASLLRNHSWPGVLNLLLLLLVLLLPPPPPQVQGPMGLATTIQQPGQRQR